MAMRVRVLRDFAGRDGAVVHKGESVDFEDDADAYALIHAGLVEPPLRLRSAVDNLIGERWCERGDLVDMPVDEEYLRGRDRRLEPLAAVVMAGEADAVAVKPAAALAIVAGGGRYATKEEAAPLDLGGADRFARPEPGPPTGPTERLFFLNGHRLADGRLVRPGTIAEVSAEEADDLVGRRYAETLVKVRMKCDGLAVDTYREAGGVVEVPRSIAGDRERFEPIGVAEKLAGKVVDVLALAGGKAAELVGPAEKPDPAAKAGPAETEPEPAAAKASKSSGRRQPAELGPGDAR